MSLSRVSSFSKEVDTLVSYQKTNMELKKILTSRELQIVNLLSQDLSYQEIADQLQLTKRTVGFHIGNALRKTQYRGKVGLAVAFVKEKIEDDTLK